MNNKTKIAVIFGGKTAEHEISLISGRNVMNALDKEKYEIIPIGINKRGNIFYFENNDCIIDFEDPKKVRLNDNGKEIAFVPRKIVGINNDTNIAIDVAFPVIHGTNGEDGSLQGLLKLANIPFVGPSVLGSAIGMDKDIMKKLLRDARIDIPKFLTFGLGDKEKINFQKAYEQIGLPMFVKPANTGSSVGISKVKQESEFAAAINEAYKYDSKILIEEGIVGREIEVSVLGNENPKASLPGEVILHHDFYSYEAKYLDENGASLEIPAKLTNEQIKNIQDIAVKTFMTLNCEGMARVDGFLTPRGQFIINEVNTIPGFTKISMYPKLWDISGLPYSALLDQLIDLAIKRYNREKKIMTNYEEL